MAINIPYIAPPDLGGKDYSASLFNAASSLGNTIAAQRNERTRSLEFSQEQERLKKQGQMDYAAAMARISADNPWGTGSNVIPGNSENINYANTLNITDPSDPRWQYALYGAYGTPTRTYQDIDGVITPVDVYPDVPPAVAEKARQWGIPLPGEEGAPSAPDTPPAPGDTTTPTATVAPPPTTTAPTEIAETGTTTGHGRTVIRPGIGEKPKTADQEKNTQLAQIMEQALPALEDKWAALEDPPRAGELLTQMGIGPYWQQAGNLATDLVGAPPVTTPDYQDASAALETIVAMFIYSASGATAPPGEVAKLTALLRPVSGEGADVKANKLARARILVQSVRDRGSTGWMPDAGAREAFISGGGGGGGGGETIDLGGDITMERY
jgi:hypothetical protein